MLESQRGNDRETVHATATEKAVSSDATTIVLDMHKPIMDPDNRLQPLRLDPPAGDVRQKLIVVLAAGPEDGGTRATIALCAAVTGRCLEQDVEVFLGGDGAHWAYQGHTDGIHRNGFPALETLMEDLIQLGGAIYVCSACDQVCGIPDDATADPPRRRPEIQPRGLAAVLVNLAAWVSVTF